MKKFLEAMRFAHACKVFDESRKIPKDEFEEILEAGRLSPSSFGLEHTKMLIIRDQALREQIKPLCWNQKQITTCSELVILKSRVKDIIAPSEYIQANMQRRGLDERYMVRLSDFQKENFKNTQAFEEWSMRQAYIVASSMVNCAAFGGIDSCYLEGFERDKLENLLGINPEIERIALVLTFGYRLNEQKPKYRNDLKNIIEFL